MARSRFDESTSRRDFLKVAAAGTAGATVGASWRPRPGVAKPAQITFLHESSFVKEFDDHFKNVLIPRYQKETGIKVNYYEDINGNPEYFATVQGRLAQGDGIGRDIIVSTDNDKYLGEYLDNGWALKLDTSLIPNISNLIDVQASPPFDPNREYTLPWFSGMDGIAWNEDVTGPVTTVKQLLEDPDLKGKVGVWGQMGDTLGLIMLSNGDDPAKVTDESFDRALFKERIHAYLTARLTEHARC